MKSLTVEKTETYTSVYYQLNDVQLVLNLSNTVKNIQLTFPEKKVCEEHKVSLTIPITNSFKSEDYYVVESNEEIRNNAQELINSSDEEGLISFIKDFYYQSF